jgi:hypothetical protein
LLDIDDTFDAVHGGLQLRLFNAHYDEYGFQPLHMFSIERGLIAPAAALPFLRRTISAAISAGLPPTSMVIGYSSGVGSARTGCRARRPT